MKKLSILIPAYNEEKTILQILYSINNVKFNSEIEKEIIVINDCSTDCTEKMVNLFVEQNKNVVLKYYLNETNIGKGACIQIGIRNATGDYVIVQDADMEYNPNEYNVLLKPIEDGFADVVFGSRFKGSNPHRILFFWHSIGNQIITLLSNMFTNLNLSDIETGYKLFKTKIIKNILLEEKRFGFEPEITAKISKVPGIRIYEVGISYYGRSYLEGKKINWKDGLRAIYCIFKYNIFSK
jgi:glycosyltransferase involved in cell wall biosynthesis